MKGLCVKCKQQTEIAKPLLKTMKNGRKAISGECSKCGCKMFKFVKADFKL